MPKTGGHDESARASQQASAPPVDPPRLHTHELHALVDDALAPDPIASSAETSTDDAAAEDALPEDALPEDALSASDPAPAELEIVDDPDELAVEPPPPPPPPRPDPYLGLLIDRRYEIQKLIAQGGMGLVYRCRHSVLGKKLAIKIIRADVAQMPDGYERFLIEAKAASAIGNEHIVDISDFGSLPDGSSYLVMEYLTGVPLSTLMKRDGRMDVPRLAEIGCQIAEGLGAAHAAGIVHRDLKPDNVFVIERKGQDFVKILDFGVARMEQSAKKLTQAGTIVGTPHYMSPEQATGKDVDHRGDIYALGVILYELCAGQVPFDGTHYVAVLHQHLQDDPPRFASLEPPALVPEELERIVDKCLAKLPEQRYASMAELAQDLAVFSTRSRARVTTGIELPAASSLSAGLPDGARARALALPEHGSGAAPAAADGLAASTLVSSAPPSAPARFPVPTAALPAPSPTLVLPRPSGSFTIEQKRRASKISLAVLIVTVAWAVWTLGRSSDPAPPAADPATAQPSPAAPAPPEPAPAVPSEQARPAAASPALPSGSAAAEAGESGNAAGGDVAQGGSSTEDTSAGSPGAGGSSQNGAARDEADAERPSPRRAESRARRARRAPSAKGTPSETRRDGERATSKRRTREFMNPWPAPR